MQSTSSIAELKIEALAWAINYCRTQLGLAPQRLLIECSNKRLEGKDCGNHERKIVIGDIQIVTYEHYSQPGNSFRESRYKDFFAFLRSWIADEIRIQLIIRRSQDSVLLACHEQAKATGIWTDYMKLAILQEKEQSTLLYRSLDEILKSTPMKLAKTLLFGEYKFLPISPHEALVGEWITQYSEPSIRIFEEFNFTIYHRISPAERYSYRVLEADDRYVKIETTFLTSGKSQEETLYFFDDYKMVQYGYGSAEIWSRREGVSTPLPKTDAST